VAGGEADLRSVAERPLQRFKEQSTELNRWSFGWTVRSLAIGAIFRESNVRHENENEHLIG